jgi:hypothetical protein
MGKESSSTLIKDLEENSSSLENLVEDFGKMTIRDGLQIRCFYETRTTQILNAVLPRQISSLMPFTEQIVSSRMLPSVFLLTDDLVASQERIRLS